MTESVLTIEATDTAAGDEHGATLILGGAGSGKTQLVLERFRALLAGGTPPERLALLLPSRARADAARATLEQRLPAGCGELVVVAPVALAATVLARAGVRLELLDAVLSPRERLAMLAQRLDELPLRHHDFGGNARALLESVVRRIDRLKAELIGAAELSAWAASQESPRAREFARLYAAHDRMLREQGACDAGDLVRLALALLADGPPLRAPFEHVLIDDAQELSLGAATLARALAGGALTVAGDPFAALTRFRGAGAARLEAFATAGTRVVRLGASRRCPLGIATAARVLSGSPAGEPGPSGADRSTQPFDHSVEFWRCENERAQAQAVAAEVERLLTRERVPAGRIAVIVGDVAHEGQAVSVALEERAVAHRLIGDAGFFQRAEVRDLLAWLRLLADPSDAAAVVRALARAPIELRSIDIARCTQIARRRKLDMVTALAAAIESPQVPPDARERIRRFLELYRACLPQIDTIRPDLYVHRLIERLGLRRAQLFAAHADAVERLRALARMGELAGAHAARSPQATAREFARWIATLAQYGLCEWEQPVLKDAEAVQVLAFEAAGGLDVDHVFVLGLRGSLLATATLDCEPVPDELLLERLPADDERTRHLRLAQRLYVAVSRARRRAVLAYAASDHAGAPQPPLEAIERLREALGCDWSDHGEDLFGPAERLHATLGALRDELMEGTRRTAGRLAELRLDTELDISHAVVRYLELLKLTALIAHEGDGSSSSPGGPSGPGGPGDLDDVAHLAESLRDVNARIAQAVTAGQREIFESSPLDSDLLDAERDARRRARAVAAREEPSLARFLPMRGDGVLLSATDIDTYRACPLRYKFARVFRIPQEPTLHQRFGIALHQVLERYHAGDPEEPGPLAGLLDLLAISWRRGGFGESDQELQLHEKATRALTRYHQRALADPARPIWFERQFSFRLGPHLVRGRVDRVDLLPSGEYELIDYKTGRPRSAAELEADVQLSLYAVGAREAWGLESARGAYYYLLDDLKVAVSGEPAQRAEWIRSVATDVAEGIMAQDFEPTPSPGVCSICDYRLICPAVER